MTGSRLLAGWRGVLLIAVVFIANELLLLAPGDVSMLYPPIRVVVLPLLCLLHAGRAVVEAVRARRAAVALPATVSLGVLLFQWLFPWPLLLAHP